MAKQIINVGSTANSKSADSLRSAFTKINANFTELYESVSGGSPSEDTIEIVTTGGSSGAEAILDLTKRTHVLKDGWYKLNAGAEGQVMHFVPHSSVTDISGINIRVNNGRYNSGTSVTDYPNNYINVFSGLTGTTLVTAVYANGSWNFDNGAWD